MSSTPPGKMKTTITRIIEQNSLKSFKELQNLNVKLLYIVNSCVRPVWICEFSMYMPSLIEAFDNSLSTVISVFMTRYFN